VTAVVARRAALLIALAGVAIVAIALISGGDKGYVVYAQFSQAGPLRQGFKVRVDGAPVGKIEKLDLDAQDRVVAKLRIDDNAAPVGRDARATARAADLLGEKFVDLDPGNRENPAPSGLVIPTSRTGLAIELDDLINALDLPTRQALRVFVNEQGSSFVGRGNDLAATLAALPSSLDRAGALLDQLSSDNEALGRLVDSSDRVVSSIARERASLGRLVGAAGTTLATLGKRRRELGETVRRAPDTLVAARRALVALEGAAIPLGPAARGLAATAPRLTATLRELPAFAAAARPTLRTVRRVSPSLRTLGRTGSPYVRRLRPLAGELAAFADAFDPVGKTLDTGIGDLLGILEGWARSTQGHDTASHVFRFGATFSPGTVLSALTTTQSQQSRARRDIVPKPDRSPARALAKAPKLRVPALPKVPKVDARHIVDNVRKGLGRSESDTSSPPPVRRLLDYLLGP
jgi:phospholipid/cholesterol/gamma-HCH transport system substrate-binding protein